MKFSHVMTAWYVNFLIKKGHVSQIWNLAMWCPLICEFEIYKIIRLVLDWGYRIQFPHLLILDGTFSEDIITTGMFLRDLDSCKIKNLILFFNIIKQKNIQVVKDISWWPWANLIWDLLYWIFGKYANSDVRRDFFIFYFKKKLSENSWFLFKK